MHKNYRTIIEREVAYPKVKAFLLKLLGKEPAYNYDLNRKDFKESIVQFF